MDSMRKSSRRTSRSGREERVVDQDQAKEEHQALPGHGKRDRDDGAGTALEDEEARTVEDDASRERCSPPASWRIYEPLLPLSRAGGRGRGRGRGPG